MENSIKIPRILGMELRDGLKWKQKKKQSQLNSSAVGARWSTILSWILIDLEFIGKRFLKTFFRFVTIDN